MINQNDQSERSSINNEINEPTIQSEIERSEEA